MVRPEPGAGRSPVEEASWQALGALLSRDLVLLPRERRLAAKRDWEDVADVERSVDDRLSVGLVGGTGVGKSTLINAFAGAEISRSGDRRPTTERVIAYRHRATELPPSLPAGDLAEPGVVHENGALERVVVLDFPDFDSVEDLHHRILERYLPHLDVLLVVVDDVKYGDSRLFDLLARLPQSEANLHGVLNKVDRLEHRYPESWRNVTEEILQDFARKLEAHAGIDMPRERLHAISARNALLSGAGTPGAAGPPAGAGEFGALVAFLEGYRIEKRRRAAKDLNIEARKLSLLDAIRRFALDPAREERVSLVADLARRRKEENERTLAGTPREILRPDERRAVISAALRREAPRIGFPLDVLITLLSELRSLRRRRRASPPDLSSKRVFTHYRPYLDGVENLLKDAEIEADGVLPIAQEGGAAAGEAAEARPYLSGAAAELGRELAAREARLAGRSKLRNHALPLLVLALFAWSFAYPAVEGAAGRLLGENPAPWSEILKDVLRSLIQALNPAVIVQAIACVALAYLLAAVFTWAREVQGLERAIGTAEGRIRERVTGHGERATGGILDVLARWRGERGEAESLTRS